MESESKPERTLSDLFTEGFNGLEAVTQSKEATNSSNVQVQVRHAITALEDCTRLVSAAGMFSSNENIEEVSSLNVRYLLLPALLGQLSLQIASDASGRLDVVLLAEAYFKDYLRRCRDYGVVEHDQVAAVLDPEENADKQIAVVKSSPKGADLAAMVQTRNDKIKRHQQQKEMESQMSELKEACSNEGADDETVRKYHMLLLRINVAQALEELSSLAMEKNILQHMARLKKESSEAEEIDESQRPPSRKPPRKSLQPVIITRDATMKAVFGAGYPSLPVLTVAEFYEQRVKDGIFPGGCGSHAGPSQMSGPPPTEESEAEIQEQHEEADNPELIARRRAMDEYKDDHRRGEGNRHNRS